jgi:hypothetical protein
LIRRWILSRKFVKRLIRTWREPNVKRNIQKYAYAQADKPHLQAGNIKIYGGPSFVGDVADALLQLEQTFPFGYSMVQRYIHAIEETTTNDKPFFGIGVRYEKRTPDGRLAVEPNRYAALLVRIAVSQRRGVHFFVPRSPRSDLLGLRKDLQAMRLLGCDKRYYHHICNQILQIERRLGRPES